MPDVVGRVVLRRALVVGLALFARDGLTQVATPLPPSTAALTVAFEIVVEGPSGRPVTDLRVEEVEVIQDATRQKVRTFRAGSRPGLYEITYAPFSGKPAGVTVRVTRRGTVVLGPDGPSLKPRLLSALSPLETELTGYLEAKSGSSDLACEVAILRFEPGAKGVRHVVAVELPLAELRFERVAQGGRGRLQVLARITSIAQPDVRQHVTLDQAVEVESDDAVGIQRLVWTGAVVVAPGRHTVEVLVRDPATGRATTRTLAVEVPPASERIASSSLVLLRPRGFFFLRDQAEGDDPLVHEGAPLMPSLRPVLQAGLDTHLRFFVALYPVAGAAQPVSLKAELLRDGAKVGEAPIALPKAEPSGEIRYVGLLATASFPAGAYVLRLVAHQGATSAAQEAAFELSSNELVRQRLEPGAAR